MAHGGRDDVSADLPIICLTLGLQIGFVFGMIAGAVLTAVSRRPPS